MHVRKLLVVFAMLLIAVNAWSVFVDHSYIKINVDSQGDATISENYWLIFESTEDEAAFEEAKERNQTSISSWNADYEWFFPKFGNILEDEMKIKTSNIIFGETENKLVLEYTIRTKFANLTREEARVSIWKIPDTVFYKYLSGGTYTIPATTRIDIIVPENAEIKKEILGSSLQATKNSVGLEGTSTKEINIEYEIKKPISTSVEEFTLLELLGNETIIMIVTGLTIILVVLTLWKGKEINNRIENYIVDHTKLEKEENEEIDIEA